MGKLKQMAMMMAGMPPMPDDAGTGLPPENAAPEPTVDWQTMLAGKPSMQPGRPVGMAPDGQQMMGAPQMNGPREGGLLQGLGDQMMGNLPQKVQRARQFGQSARRAFGAGGPSGGGGGGGY